MTSWSPASHRAVRIVCTLLLIITFLPATARTQEQAPAAPASQPAAQAAPAPAPASPAPAPPAPAPQPEQQTYAVRQGDTLWDIANAIYRDPFLWPLIWKSNPSIVDPDLIYPDTSLVIPSLAPVERAMSAPEEPAPVEEKVVQEKAIEKPVAAPGAVKTAAAAAAAPDEAPAHLFQRRTVAAAAEEEAPAAGGSTLILPEDAPIPIMDRYAMLSAGYISEESSQDRLEGAMDERAEGSERSNYLGYDQQVYISVKSRESVNVGDRFVIFEEEHEVRHPVTGKKFGRLYKVNGVVTVTGAKEKDVYLGRITLAFDAAQRGNMLAPYQEPTLLYPSKQKQAKNLTGHVLEVTDRKTASGQANILFLDKGKEDGVDPGDRFTIMSAPSPGTGVRHPIAEVQVYVVKARTATAYVRKSTEEIAKGLPVVFKN